MQARFYPSATLRAGSVPTLGRFLSPDSIVPGYGNPQSLNRYSYVLNNPLRYTDPTGHCIFGAPCIDDAVDAAQAIYEFAVDTAASGAGLGLDAWMVGWNNGSDVVQDAWIVAWQASRATGAAIQQDVLEPIGEVATARVSGLRSALGDFDRDSAILTLDTVAVSFMAASVAITDTMTIAGCLVGEEIGCIGGYITGIAASSGFIVTANLASGGSAFLTTTKGDWSESAQAWVFTIGGVVIPDPHWGLFVDILQLCSDLESQGKSSSQC